LLADLRFSETISRPPIVKKDIGIHRELAALARQLGREEAAAGSSRQMTDDPVPASKGPDVPLKPLEFDQSNPNPVVRKPSGQAGPQPAPNVKGSDVRQPPAGENRPKACGEEPAVSEGIREQPTKVEQPAAKKDETKEGEKGR
jgi:hypothetical protein